MHPKGFLQLDLLATTMWQGSIKNNQEISPQFYDDQCGGGREGSTQSLRFTLVHTSGGFVA